MSVAAVVEVQSLINKSRTTAARDASSVRQHWYRAYEENLAAALEMLVPGSAALIQPIPTHDPLPPAALIDPVRDLGYRIIGLLESVEDQQVESAYLGAKAAIEGLTNHLATIG